MNIRRLPRYFALTVLAVLVWNPLLARFASAQDEVPPDFYPQIGFPILDADERQMFVELAESELCPCPGAPRSLSACLLDEEARCTLAEQVSSLMIRRIKEDLSAAEIRDELTTFITDASTPRDFDLDEAPHLGPTDAPVQLVVFSDFECPFCRRFAATEARLHE
ncbi:MAG: thioredoxin domain-containing protein, partial [Myxococcales bacterium]|nr:thioredoxin domain-containing protein [Myxococcales bacterium]